jgi:hypothetical protein
MNKQQIEAVLEKVRSWPQEDQEELAELARDIEARRTGVYAMTEDERRAVAAAREGPLTGEDEVADFWKRRGLA